MDKLWRWLNENRNLWVIAAGALGIYLIGQAAVFNRWTFQGWPRPSLVSAVAGLVFAGGVYRRQPWARWVGLVWVTLFTVSSFINGFLNGWSLMDTVMAVGLLVWMAAYCYEFFFSQRTADADDSKPLLSLVLLLRESRYLDATILAGLASRAWDVEVTTRTDHEETEGPVAESDTPKGWIVGDAPLFMGMHPSAIFAVHHFDRPYFDEPEEAAKAIPDLRLRQILLEHQAWTAMDVIHWFGEGDPKTEAYRLIAELLAELANDLVLAVFDPETGQMFCYNSEMESKLRSENPLAALREGAYVPVIGVSEDDPLMLAAVEAARRQWPQFVSAFEIRNVDAADDHFSVKAPFGDGDNVEHMWVEVTGIENDVIYGKLGNDPANQPGLALGDAVRVNVADISDWMCIADGKLSGGFSIKVVEKRAREFREQSEPPAE